MILLNKNTLPGYTSGVNDYSEKDTSYSPFYSNIGLEIKQEEKGIGKFHLHYNRFSRVLWNNTVRFGETFSKENSVPEKVLFSDGAALSFFSTDAFELSVKSDGKAELLKNPDEAIQKQWIAVQSESYMLIRGYSLNGDGRDPDETVPFMLGIKALKGTLEYSDGKFFALPDKEKNILLAFAFEFLTPDEDSIMQKLNTAPEGTDKCAKLCLNEINFCLNELNILCNENEISSAARAINGLIENTAKAPGLLKNHLSAYPSRGYSSHFLWDTCFQNLAYEEMNPSLAKEFLLQFKACQRADGKYMQFLCSTWGRPHFSQPSLAGWACKRLFEKTNDLDLIKEMLPSLELNNSWWLNSRITEYGLISCKDGLETGQDDSPRFDNGTTLSCDMNSYLLSQLNITAEFCKILGDEDGASKWHKKAKELSDAIIKYLYNEKENIFFDASPLDLSPVKIISPVSLLPLWAGAELEDSKKRAMIEKYLLSPELLFGEIPFPSVSYSDENYEAEHWWRGPTWMSEAWLMLEILKNNGYKEQYALACERLLNVLVKDEKMHELFNSQTGEGMGYEQQGWTCAIYIALLSERQKIKGDSL